MQNQYFEALAERFAKNIYGSEKGKIRIEVLKQDLQPYLQKNLTCLDIGAGFGQFSLWLAKNNIEITLLEPTESMLTHAKKNFYNENIQARFINSAWQSFNISQTYDLLVCHAVMEWLQDPYSILDFFNKYSTKNTILSLAIYNKHALIYRNLLKGHFEKINKHDFAGIKQSLTPQNPINPDTLEENMQKYWSLVGKSGIRVFYDYMPVDFRKKTDFNEILANEIHYRKHPAFINLGRYIHFIYKKK